MNITITDAGYVEIDGKIIGDLSKAFATIATGGDPVLVDQYVQKTLELQAAVAEWSGKSRVSHLMQTETRIQQAISHAQTAREKLDTATERLSQLTISNDYHRKRADLAVALAEHCTSNNTEAAIAVTREIRRLDLASRTAAIDAELAALAGH